MDIYGVHAQAVDPDRNPYLNSRADQNWNRVNSGKLAELDQSLIRTFLKVDRVASEKKYSSHP